MKYTVLYLIPLVNLLGQRSSKSVLETPEKIWYTTTAFNHSTAMSSTNFSNTKEDVRLELRRGKDEDGIPLRRVQKSRLHN